MTSCHLGLLVRLLEQDAVILCPLHRGAGGEVRALMCDREGDPWWQAGVRALEPRRDAPARALSQGEGSVIPAPPDTDSNVECRAVVTEPPARGCELLGDEDSAKLSPEKEVRLSDGRPAIRTSTLAPVLPSTRATPDAEVVAEASVTTVPPAGTGDGRRMELGEQSSPPRLQTQRLPPPK